MGRNGSLLFFVFILLFIGGLICLCYYVELDRYAVLLVGLEFDWTISLMTVGCVVLFGNVLNVGEVLIRNFGFPFGRCGLDEVGW